MSAQTNLNAVVAKQKAEQAVKDKEDEKKALKEEAPTGKVLVRLVRDAYTKEGILLRAGLQYMKEDEIPSSAKRIKE